MNKLLIFILLAAGRGWNAGADGSTEQMMRKLVEARAEIEQMSREMDSTQKERQADLDLWLQKQAELTAAVQKESLRRLQLMEKTGLLSLRVKAESKANPQAKRELLARVAAAQGWLDHSLPFRRDSRAEALSSIVERAETGLESIESLSAELWQFYDKELKMAADNEFRITDVTTASGTQKAEVARLGLYTLFARTPDGKILRALEQQGGWSMQEIEPARASEVNRLLDNMKGRKKSGLYSLSLSSVKEIQ